MEGCAFKNDMLFVVVALFNIREALCWLLFYLGVGGIQSEVVVRLMNSILLFEVDHFQVVSKACLIWRRHNILVAIAAHRFDQLS